MSKLHLVKQLGAAITQPFAQSLLASYAGVSAAAKQVPRQKIQFLGNKMTDYMAADLDDVLNAKFSAHDLFRKQIPKGFNLDRTFHFAFDPSTKFGVPLQMLQEGQTIEVEAFGWVLRDPVNKKIYIFFKGTVFSSTEILASTGTKVGFNNEDTVPADVLIKGMPGLAKGSNARWMSSSVKYIDANGKERVLVKSMTEQMREYAQRKDLEGYEIILLGHSVGATELAVMYTHLGLFQPHLLSALAFCVGPYRFLTKDAVQWMNQNAPGPWINVINGNDFVSLASTIRGSMGTGLLTRPDITEEIIQQWLKDNPFWLPGQAFGFESVQGVGWSPFANHSTSVYEIALRPENYGLILPLEDGIEGVLRFKPQYGKFQPIEPRTEEDRALIATLKDESQGYIHN
ncbi:hypothetical protein M440DRAFT_1459004 [Trichoderma longibrachiatum ATCC 18648]|uniref:Alpha/beta-hydrolase n=1 Tax=Trichoderma longibrachiatum ATCC 18648 TaxID=983965 RepID=A0A2T4C1F8_TRILO|nr:hypothetical protein M440DRAFT_1459004 [Trichoderma longibrachiatum ATCC 18648]